MPTYHSPIGPLRITATEKGITSITLVEEEQSDAECSAVIQDCIHRFHAYFAGERDAFTGMPMDIQATEFQKSVLQALAEIPYGETTTYGAIAAKIGNPQAVRAVGTAVGRNPLGIALPCHRVLPSTRAVGNYAWGAERKKWLLIHEGVL